MIFDIPNNYIMIFDIPNNYIMIFDIPGWCEKTLIQNICSKYFPLPLIFDHIENEEEYENESENQINSGIFYWIILSL